MSQTTFKEPKSDKFIDMDGWVFNDTSGKNFQVDYQNHLEALDSISCKFIKLKFYLLKKNIFLNNQSNIFAVMTKFKKSLTSFYKLHHDTKIISI